MRILVLDDKKIHREAAKVQLAGHDLTIVSTYDGAETVLYKSRYSRGFDAFLTDLLVPASRRSQGAAGMQFVGQEMPIGTILALQAATRCKVRHVGVLTDLNHHDHPASACFDGLFDYERRTPFTIEESKVIFSNLHVGRYEPKDLSKPLTYDDLKVRTDLTKNDLIVVKNWASLLADLTQ